MFSITNELTKRQKKRKKISSIDAGIKRVHRHDSSVKTRSKGKKEQEKDKE